MYFSHTRTYILSHVIFMLSKLEDCKYEILREIVTLLVNIMANIKYGVIRM
jgi:hypothetical protein